MAFNINAQVILSGPKNLAKVRSSIKKGLQGISVGVKLKIAKKASQNLKGLNTQVKKLTQSLNKLNSAATKTTAALNALAAAAAKAAAAGAKVGKGATAAGKGAATAGKQLKQAGNEMEQFGKDAALAIRRFAAFTLATGAIFGLVRAISGGIKAAIEFDRQMVRIVQVTGASQQAIGGLQKTIDKLSTSLGVSSAELLDVARTFAQTGQSLSQVKSSIEAVARASLAPTFGDMKSTTEGLIAVMAQFNIQANRSEAILGQLNAVSKKFAVESSDLISVIRRAGGVFAAASGEMAKPEEALAELISIFTAVRSTTRETADTIAVGLRTIFSRLQRRSTISFLKGFDIELKDAEGRFVGFYKAFEALSKGLSDISAKGDTLTIAAIVEELGGIRQVGKLIPAIQQFTKAEEARKVALEGTASISGDVELATQSLAKQIEILSAKFTKLMRDIQQSSSFQTLAKFALSTATAFVSLADALRPALPLLTLFASLKLAGAAVSLSRGFIGGLKKGGGGSGAGGSGSGSGGSGSGPTAAANAKLTAAVTANTSALTNNTTQLTSLNTRAGIFTTLNLTLTHLISSVDALKLAMARGGGGGGIPRQRNGQFRRFARGGRVHGPSHAAGGVIAELEGGETVLPRAMGGGVGLHTQSNAAFVTPEFSDPQYKDRDNIKVTAGDVFSKGRVGFKPLKSQFPSSGNQKLTVKEVSDALGWSSRSYKIGIEGVGKKQETAFAKAFNEGVKGSLDSAGNSIASIMGVKFPDTPKIDSTKFYDMFDSGFKGLLFENILSAYNGQPLSAEQLQRPFDFIHGIKRSKASQVYEGLSSRKIQYIDAKITSGSAKQTGKGSIENKIHHQLSEDIIKNLTNIRRAKGHKLAILPQGTSNIDVPKKSSTGGVMGGIGVAISSGEAVVPPDVARTNLNTLHRVNNGYAVGENTANSILGSSTIASGPGTGTSDSILTSLPSGSYVINEKATRGLVNKTAHAATGGHITSSGVSSPAKFAAGGKLGTAGAQGLLGATFAVSTLASLDFGSLTGLITTAGLIIIQLKFFKDTLTKSAEEVSAELKKLADAAVAATPVLGSRPPRQPDPLGTRRARREAMTRQERIDEINQRRNARGQSDLPDKLTKFGGNNPFKNGKFKFGGGNIAALVGSLALGSVIPKIEEGLGQTEAGGYKGFGGRTILGSGAETATTVAGLGGAAQGALAGAGIGSIFGPIGTAVGTVAGAFVGAITAMNKAMDEQARFEVFNKLSASAVDVNSAFEELETNIKSASKAQAAIAATTKFNRELYSGAEALARINRGYTAGETTVYILSRAFRRAADVLGLLGPKVFFVTKLFDKFAEHLETRVFQENVAERRAATDPIERGSGFLDVLGSLDEAELKKNSEIARKRLEYVLKDLPLEDLEKLPTTLDGLEFGRLINELKYSGEAGELAAKEIKGFNESLLLQQAKDLQVKIDKVAGTGENANLKVRELLAGTIADPARQFNQDVLERGLSPDKAENRFLATKVENLGAILRNMGSDISDETAGNIVSNFPAFRESNPEQAAQFAESFGVSLAEMTKIFGMVGSGARDYTQALTEELPAFIAATLATDRMNKSMQSMIKGLDAISAAFASVEDNLSRVAESMARFAGDFSSEFNNIFNTRRQVRGGSVENVFTNPAGRTRGELQGGFDRISAGIGDTTGGVFRGGAELLDLSNNLPTILKDVVDSVRSDPDFNTEKFDSAAILKKFEDAAGTSLSALPNNLQESIRTGLNSILTGSNRQLGDDTQIGIDAAEKFLQENVEKLGTTITASAEDMRKHGEAAAASIAKMNISMDKISNLMVDAGIKRAAAELKISDRTQAFSDRFDKYSGAGRDPSEHLGRASDRLRGRLSSMVSAGGAGSAAGINVLSAADLAAKRDNLEVQVRRDQAALDAGDRTDPAAMIALQQTLEKNIIALDGVRKAEEALADDVSRLEAVDKELASIQTSKLSQRELTAKYLRDSEGKSPQEQAILYAKLMETQIAAVRARTTGVVSRGEAAALATDTTGLRNAGYSDREIDRFGADATGAGGRAIAGDLARGGLSRGVARGAATASSGLGATTIGADARSRVLLGTAAGINTNSADATRNITKKNEELLLEQQQKYRAEIIKTSAELLAITHAAAGLRDTSLSGGPRKTQDQVRADEIKRLTGRVGAPPTPTSITVPRSPIGTGGVVPPLFPPTPAAGAAPTTGGGRVEHYRRRRAAEAARRYRSPRAGMGGMMSVDDRVSLGDKRRGGETGSLEGVGAVFNGFIASFTPLVNTFKEAATTLSGMTITLDAKVGPVEVILNGASVISQFGEKVKNEILMTVGEQLQDYVKKNALDP